MDCFLFCLSVSEEFTTRSLSYLTNEFIFFFIRYTKFYFWCVGLALLLVLVQYILNIINRIIWTVFHLRHIWNDPMEQPLYVGWYQNDAQNSSTIWWCSVFTLTNSHLSKRMWWLMIRLSCSVFSIVSHPKMSETHSNTHTHIHSIQYTAHNAFNYSEHE